MGFAFNIDGATFYYKIEDIQYYNSKDNLYHVVFNLCKYNFRYGDLLSTIPLTIDEMPLDINKDIKEQVYNFAKKTIILNFEDILEGGE